MATTECVSDFSSTQTQSEKIKHGLILQYNKSKLKL